MPRVNRLLDPLNVRHFTLLLQLLSKHLDPVHTGPDPYGTIYQFEKSQDEHDS